jgi:hypothetical protein
MDWVILVMEGYDSGPKEDERSVNFLFEGFFFFGFYMFV